MSLTLLPEVLRRHALVLGGAAVTLVLAASLFSRFSLQTGLTRDESIYAYGGQQTVEGVPFYVSIFDMKPPLATIIAGGGVAAARVLGLEDLTGIRLAFFVFACLSVLAVYLLVTWLFSSVAAGLIAAATFASFKGFALDALTGPNAKTPGIFFAVLSMALLVRRHYFWGGLAGSLAFLVWQPLALYVGVAVLAALLTPEGKRRLRLAGEALAGAAIPIVVTVVYFWLEGALDDLVDGAFVLPVTHLERGDSLDVRLERLERTIDNYYSETALLFYGGLVLVLVLAALRIVQRRHDLRALAREDPFINVILVSFLFTAAVPAVDFQGYPDLYALLPYAAIGIGGGFSLVLDRFERARLPWVGAAAAAAAVIALVVVSWNTYSDQPVQLRTAHPLSVQRFHAARIEDFLEEGETPYVLGNATPLVLTERRNPSPYIYLAAGVDSWAVDQTPGGVEGWQAEIVAEDPPLIVLGGQWRSEIATEMKRWLNETYERVRRGDYLVYLRPEVYDRAERRGLVPRRADSN
ncbi:MAG: ArnT family glycosyltransferase [Gaiellaceae bacterium]